MANSLDVNVPVPASGVGAAAYTNMLSDNISAVFTPGVGGGLTIVQIEGSNDAGAHWSPIALLRGAGTYILNHSCQRMRARVVRGNADGATLNLNAISNGTGVLVGSLAVPAAPGTSGSVNVQTWGRSVTALLEGLAEDSVVFIEGSNSGGAAWQVAAEIIGSKGSVVIPTNFEQIRCRLVRGTGGGTIRLGAQPAPVAPYGAWKGYVELDGANAYNVLDGTSVGKFHRFFNATGAPGSLIVLPASADCAAGAALAIFIDNTGQDQTTVQTQGGDYLNDNNDGGALSYIAAGKLGTIVYVTDGAGRWFTQSISHN